MNRWSAAEARRDAAEQTDEHNAAMRAEAREAGDRELSTIRDDWPTHADLNAEQKEWEE